MFPSSKFLLSHPANPPQAQGENRKLEASAEKELSHTTAKAGPFTTTASGGISKDDPNRAAGSWNQNVGALKESIGGFVGAEGLKQEGIQQNADGKGQEAEGQVKALRTQVDTVKATASVQKAQMAIASRTAGANSGMSNALESLERIKQRQAETTARLEASEELDATSCDGDLNRKLAAAGLLEERYAYAVPKAGAGRRISRVGMRPAPAGRADGPRPPG